MEEIWCCLMFSNILNLDILTSLRSFVQKNTSVVLIGNIIGNLLRIVSTVVLTRILTAGDFGAMAIVATALYIFVMLSDVGFYPFIVRHDLAEDPSFLDEVWTIRLVRGTILTLLLICCSPILARLLGKPQLWPVLAFSAVQLLLEAMSSMSFATAPKQARLLPLVGMDLAVQVLGLVITTVLALSMRSYWALAVGAFFASAVKVFLSYRLFPGSARRFSFSIARSRELWLFGRYVTLSSNLQILVSQADRLILARIMPLNNYGLYSIASNLSQAPQSLTGGYVARVLYPIFAARKDGVSTVDRHTYYAAGRSFRLLYMAVVGAFIALSPLVVRILYDPRYAGASLYLQLLSLAALVHLPVAVATEYMTAMNGAVQFMRLSFTRVICMFSSGAILFFYMGSIGVVLGVLCGELGAQIYSWHALSRSHVLSIRAEAAYFLLAAFGYGAGHMLLIVVSAVFPSLSG